MIDGKDSRYFQLLAETTTSRVNGVRALKRLLHLNNLSPCHGADVLDIPRPQFIQWLNGNRGMYPDSIKKVCDGFGITPAKFFELLTEDDLVHVMVYKSFLDDEKNRDLLAAKQTVFKKGEN